MWYAITAGSGLLIGLGLMIWGLAERAKRHSAERDADKAMALLKTANDIAENNIKRVTELEQERSAQSDELAALRGRLNEARTRLAESADPKAVKEWLDAETKEETL